MLVVRILAEKLGKKSQQFQHKSWHPIQPSTTSTSNMNPKGKGPWIIINHQIDPL
jgi:hypothetical protein